MLNTNTERFHWKIESFLDAILMIFEKPEGALATASNKANDDL